MVGLSGGVICWPHWCRRINALAGRQKNGEHYFRTIFVPQEPAFGRLRDEELSAIDGMPVALVGQGYDSAHNPTAPLGIGNGHRGAPLCFTDLHRHCNVAFRGRDPSMSRNHHHRRVFTCPLVDNGLDFWFSTA